MRRRSRYCILAAAWLPEVVFWKIGQPCDIQEQQIVVLLTTSYVIVVFIVVVFIVCHHFSLLLFFFSSSSHYCVSTIILHPHSHHCVEILMLWYLCSLLPVLPTSFLLFCPHIPTLLKWYLFVIIIHNVCYNCLYYLKQFFSTSSLYIIVFKFTHMSSLYFICFLYLSSALQFL